MKPRALVLLLATLATACGSGQSGEPTGLDGDWRLVSGDAVSAPDGHPITLSLDGDRVSGRAACNSYDGTARVEGESLEVTAVSMTEMACEEPAMTAEAAFMEALLQVERVRRAGRTMVLTGPAGELRFEPVEPVPTASLVGTPWRLDTLIVDDTASTVTGDATLRFGSDGSFAGSTGCRDFTGSYVRTEDEIETTGVTPASSPDDCQTASALQDELVLAVIGGPFEAEVDGDRLTLTAGRQGLGYRRYSPRRRRSRRSRVSASSASRRREPYGSV